MTDQNLILEMFKEVSTELRSVQKKMSDNHDAAIKEISKNREDFVIFRATINAKTATISFIIGLVMAATGLYLQHRKMHKAEKEQVKYEQTYIKTT